MILQASFWCFGQIKKRVRLSEPSTVRSCCPFLCNIHSLSFQTLFSTLTVSRRGLKRCSHNLPPDSVLEQVPISCLFPLMWPGLCMKWLTVQRIGWQRQREHRWLISIYGIMLWKDQRPILIFIHGCSCYGFLTNTEDSLYTEKD